VGGLWGTGGNNVWAAVGSSTLQHWDGASWTPVAPGFSVPMFAIWGRSATELWAGGQDGKLAAYDGTHWTALHKIPGYHVLGFSGAGSTVLEATYYVVACKLP